MIEDKENGIKIAENPIEALWTNTKNAATERIKQLENTLIIERAFLELCISKLAKVDYEKEIIEGKI